MLFESAGYEREERSHSMGEICTNKPPVLWVKRKQLSSARQGNFGNQCKSGWSWRLLLIYTSIKNLIASSSRFPQERERTGRRGGVDSLALLFPLPHLDPDLLGVVSVSLLHGRYHRGGQRYHLPVSLLHFFRLGCTAGAPLAAAISVPEADNERDDGKMQCPASRANRFLPKTDWVRIVLWTLPSPRLSSLCDQSISTIILLAFSTQMAPLRFRSPTVSQSFSHTS